MKPEMPKTERLTDDPISDSVTTHPAFAMIGANRWQGGGGYLFGSDFKHQCGVSITIRRAQVNRGLSNDYYHGLDELISVNLSEAQWAGFVSSFGGHETPCTLEHVDRKAVPQIAGVEDRRAQIRDEMKRRTMEVVADLDRLAQLIEKGSGKKEMRSLIGGIKAGLGPSIAFIAEQFDEHIEKTTEQAKTEIEAFANNVITRTGLAALKGEKLPFSLPKKEDK